MVNQSLGTCITNGKKGRKKRKKTAHNQRINDHSCCITDVHQNSMHAYMYDKHVSVQRIYSLTIHFFRISLAHSPADPTVVHQNVEWWQASRQAGTYT